MLKDGVGSLEENKNKEYMIEDIRLIENNLNRIKNITESMREVADTQKVHVRRMNLYRAMVVSLRLMHHKAKKITRINLQDEKFDLDLDRDHKVYTVKADNRKLEQAFIAIIDNALDQLEQYGDFEENLLDIKIVQNKDDLEITFKDNGGGIDKKLLPNIFDPFKSNKKHRGLGIGMSIVKKIIDEHGFEISVKNEDDGALVTIKIGS